MLYQVKSKEDLEAKLKEAGDKLVVIDFYATWCGPCKRIAPILDEIAKQHVAKLVVLKVDVDENEEVTNEYKVEVMPTFIFKRSGEHIDTLAGSNEDKLKELIEKNLNCFTIVRNFLQYPFIIDMYDVHPNLIGSLPGITICNNNRMSLKRLIERNSSVNQALTENFPDWIKDQKPQMGYNFDRFRDTLAKIFQNLNYEPQAELDNSTQNDLFDMKPDDSNFIRWLGCARTWQDSIDCGSLSQIDSVQDRRCTTLLHKGAILYDSINYPQIFNNTHRTYSDYDSYFDVKEVVRMLVDFEPEDYADLKRQIGARIIFHGNNYVASSTELDFYVTRGYRYDFIIEREDMLLLDKPYGSCYQYEKKNLRTYMYDINPRIPLYGETCFQNCVIKNVIHVANCWPPTMPYFRNDSLDPYLNLKPCIWRSREHQHTAWYKKLAEQESRQKNDEGPKSISGGEVIDIESEANVEFRNYMKIRRHCWAQCALPCRIVKYSVTVTRSKWPSEVRTLFDRTGSDGLLNHCCALITIKLTHFHHHINQFLPKYNLADTFGSIGGLLAVWLGLSMVSVYHAIQKLVSLCNKQSLAKVHAYGADIA